MIKVYFTDDDGEAFIVKLLISICVAIILTVATGTYAVLTAEPPEEYRLEMKRYRELKMKVDTVADTAMVLADWVTMNALEVHRKTLIVSALMPSETPYDIPVEFTGMGGVETDTNP